jgi:type I restriction enzyme, S subunit
MPKLTAAQERFQKNVVIIAARQAIYTAVVKKYGNGVRIETITDVVTKGTTPKTYGFDFIESGIPFLRAEDVLDGKVNFDDAIYSIDEKTHEFMSRSKTQSGDVLITIAGSIGRAAVVPKYAPELNMNQAVALIRCKDTVDPYYLCHLIQSLGVQEQVRNSTVSSAISNLSLGNIKQLVIPLPPINEQKVIAQYLEFVQNKDSRRHSFTGLPEYANRIQSMVARIEALAARVAESQSLRREADIQAKSLLNSALSKITQDLLANHEPQTLEELTLFIGDMNHEMPKGQDKGIPFVSPKDFIKDDGNIGIDFDGAKKISTDDFDRLSKKACPQKGDILMARYGTIGAARYVDTDRKFLASYSIAVIRPNPELVDGRFLYWMSVSPYVQEQAIKGIRGSSMADLGLKTIRQFIIPHLSFDEQRRLVAYLDGLQAQVSALRAKQAETERELSALLPSVLDRAFKP